MASSRTDSNGNFYYSTKAEIHEKDVEAALKITDSNIYLNNKGTWKEHMNTSNYVL